MAGLDREVLKQLRDDVGDEVLGDLVETFVSDSTRLAGALGRGLIDGDLDTVKRAAHELKGTAQIFGALELAQACADLKNARTVDDGARACVARTIRESASVRAALRVAVSEMSPR